MHIVTRYILLVCLANSFNVFAQAIEQPAVVEQPTANQTSLLSSKEQLFNQLSSGNVQSGSYDANSEVQIANSQMALASNYLSIGDRKSAAIAAITARKLLQNVYGNPYDPRLVPIYSLLVQIYESDVDTDYPSKDMSDANQAKMYRQMIDHIHAE